MTKKPHNSVHGRRFLAYLVLILMSFLCLVWF